MNEAAVRVIAGSSVALAGLVGLYGRRRTDFASDFCYNKFHFGVWIQVAAGVGMFKIVKYSNRVQYLGLTLFSSAMLLNSVPSYNQGFAEIRNVPIDYYGKGTMRKIGFYSLVSGYFLIWLASRGKLPLLMLV